MGLIINIIINIVIIAPALWLSGILLAGKNKAKFTDALWIVTLGTIVSAVFGYFLWEGIIASVILMVILLGLVKHFFNCGWIKAVIISIVAVIIFIIIAAILALIGIGIGFYLI
ncbi:MAG: hypothetical protein FWD52_08555 [Candidatus Bathyarchaeota archaeon]|nr:hypothetical protein [Candidatus Termiticorpusculum sp.]